MRIEQYVMAYGCEQDRLRAILPEGFTSLRPVLRINAEIRDDKFGYIEFNTAVESDGVKGWLNIGYWEDVTYIKIGDTTTFEAGQLEISFKKTGFAGGCPAEKDNEGCFFVGENVTLKFSEKISENKEFCDCKFSWNYENGTHGVSIGKTLPAIPSEIKNVYPKVSFSVENAATIECQQVLGSYVVCFER